MRLSVLQSGFLGWLASGNEEEVQSLPLRRAEGLATYQNNYRTSLMECLAETYPQTMAWLGEADFAAAAARHIDRTPPHSWTLDDYADGLPASLSMDYPDDPEIGEMARIELALSQGFVAADAAVMKRAQVADMDWDAAWLQVIPALVILRQNTNAAEIWMALAEGQVPPLAQEQQDAGGVLIWRREGICRLRRLDGDEAAMLEMLAGGPLPFGQICEHAVALWGAEKGIPAIGQWLARWVGDGLIAAAQA
ncbi:HvfC/BufC N-terminal domain-containing protein [Novosphingobium humi]|uniref:HvfC/BufC N-terminal domain-containing protein n=1 Tax=Novosphingobium humi TaxID=2282397 RepID=UPI0025AFA21F|nr:DNA-binding domain-containing protein [Novosphingobium humi]WJS97769.1 DNA-binding domain-containing protein [Novosphingobium humi]